jgi:outer membrane protein OmpA-like peptidoglycan-associated protein
MRSFILASLLFAPLAHAADAETWVHVAGYVGEGDAASTQLYVVTIVEKAAMQQVVSAKELADDLQRTGRAVLAVQFDTGKDTIKPESAPLVKAMADLLKQNPSLKVLIVGHTDMQGDLEANVKLSQARAASVQKALVGQHGIAAARLSAHGVGALSPVATNDTEAGRAQNRRVELVKR